MKQGRYKQRQQHGCTDVVRGTADVPLTGPAGEALRAWGDELRASCGVDLSVQQETLVLLAMRDLFYLNQIDGWAMAQPSVINKRKREAFAIMKTRAAIAESLARRLQQLGLERKAVDVDVAATLARLHDEGEGDEG